MSNELSGNPEEQTTIRFDVVWVFVSSDNKAELFAYSKSGGFEVYPDSPNILIASGEKEEVRKIYQELVQHSNRAYNAARV